MPKKMLRLNRESRTGPEATIVPSVALTYVAFVYLTERDCTPPTTMMLAKTLGCRAGAISSRLFRLFRRGYLSRHPGVGLSRPYYLAGERCRYCHGSGVHHQRAIATDKGRTYTVNDLATITESDDVFVPESGPQVPADRAAEADPGPA